MFVNFNILNQLGSPAINSNTFANRPAAGQTGRLFVSTDTFEIYRDNGTSWDLIGGPGSSTVTGTGASGQVTYWTGASTIAGNNNLFWDIANSRLGIGTTTPGHKLQINGTGTLLSLNGGSDTYMLFAGNGADQYQIGYTDNALDYRRFSIYDSTGAKEVLTIDKQSRNVGINYQYSSLADQPAYTFDVSGSIRSTDSTFLATNGTSQVGINTVSPVATALIQANKTDGYGLYLNYTTNTGSGTTATALWAINTTAGSGFAAVIEEKTPNTTGGQYPLAIKHSLSSGTAAAGMGTGLHFQLPDDLGNFKTTQLTVETTDASNTTYTTRYRFMAQVNNISTPLAYLTSVGLGIGNVIPAYKLDVNGTVRAFGVGNTGNFLAVDTNPGGASVNLNPQYGTGLPILYTNGAFPLLFGTNNTENARFATSGNFLIGGTSDNGNKLQVTGSANVTGSLTVTTSIRTGADNFTAVNGGWFFTGTVGNYTNGIFASSSSNVLTLRAPLTQNFETNSATRMTLDSSGNLLIGTTSGGYGNLAVYTASNTLLAVANSTSYAQLQQNGADLYINVNLSGAAGGSTVFRRGSGATESMRIDQNGLVGIGTSGPASLLAVGGNPPTAGTISAQTTAQGVSLALSDNINSSLYVRNANGGAIIGTDPSGTLRFATNGNTGADQKMVITAAGNVGVGVSSPNNYGGGFTNFQVNGSSFGLIQVTNSSNIIGSFYSSTNEAQIGTTSNNAFGIFSNDVRRMTFPTSGNVLIGTTTDAGYKLQVNGTISANNLRLNNGSSTLLEMVQPGFYTYNFITNNNNLAFRVDSTTVIRFYDTGNIENNGSIKTGGPTTGTAAPWKLGSKVTTGGILALDVSNYIEVEINGVFYKLGIVN